MALLTPRWPQGLMSLQLKLNQITAVLSSEVQTCWGISVHSRGDCRSQCGAEAAGTERGPDSPEVASSQIQFLSAVTLPSSGKFSQWNNPSSLHTLNVSKNLHEYKVNDLIFSSFQQWEPGFAASPMQAVPAACCMSWFSACISTACS